MSLENFCRARLGAALCLGLASMSWSRVDKVDYEGLTRDRKRLSLLLLLLLLLLALNRNEDTRVALFLNWVYSISSQTRLAIVVFDHPLSLCLCPPSSSLLPPLLSSTPLHPSSPATPTPYLDSSPLREALLPAFNAPFTPSYRPVLSIASSWTIRSSKGMSPQSFWHRPKFLPISSSRTLLPLIQVFQHLLYVQPLTPQPPLRGHLKARRPVYWHLRPHLAGRPDNLSFAG
jgi:hypothetical protein